MAFDAHRAAQRWIYLLKIAGIQRICRTVVSLFAVASLFSIALRYFFVIKIHILIYLQLLLIFYPVFSIYFSFLFHTYKHLYSLD